ncbi:hypothetical protein AAMO2058_000436600 [Amorphochlora amoebiformis]
MNPDYKDVYRRQVLYRNGITGPEARAFFKPGRQGGSKRFEQFQARQRESARRKGQVQTRHQKLVPGRKLNKPAQTRPFQERSHSEVDDGKGSKDIPSPAKKRKRLSSKLRRLKPNSSTRRRKPAKNSGCDRASSSTKKLNREEVRKAIRFALSTATGELETRMETAIYEEHHPVEGTIGASEGDQELSQEYIKAARLLVMRLKSKEYRSAVLDGKIPPEEAYRRIQETAKESSITHRLRQVVREEDKGDLLNKPCGRCGQMQLYSTMCSRRRDIGKCETWGNKDDVERIRITCDACGHSSLKES